MGSFELQAPAGPVLTQPTPFSVCDDVGEPNDGITVFDLTSKDAEITGGDIGVAVRYYETAADAQGDTNAIDPAKALNEANRVPVQVIVDYHAAILEVETFGEHVRAN